MRDLFEVERRYHSNLVLQVEQYRGRGYWIHFGETPKLGVRAKTDKVFHSDPQGVYFYDLDWLMGHERFESGLQYAANMPYWTIVKLNPSPSGIVMSKLNTKSLTALADKQKWIDFADYQKKLIDNGYSDPAHKTFWRYVTRFPKRSNSLLHGIPYVLDDGTGTIHSVEPYQLAVFDPRSIAIVAKGNQYSGRYAAAVNKAKNTPEYDQVRSKSEKTENFNHITISLLKELRARYGGEIAFKKDIPSLTINGPHSSFVIGPDTSILYSNESYKMVARWGRAVKTIRIDYYKTTEMPMATLVQFFSSVIDHVLSLKDRDLFFTPAMPPKTAQKIIKGVLPNAVITTEINNSSANIDVTGENKFEEQGVKLTTFVRAYITKTEADWFIDGRIGLKDSGSSWGGIFLSYRATELSDLSSLRQDMLEKTELHNPSSDLYRKFYHQDNYEAFLGWICVNSGLPALLTNQDWIDQYRRADKTILMRDITRVYSRY